jgi:hypothetical protein
MKFFLCDPCSRKTWDVYGMIKEAYPYFQIYMLCRNTVDVMALKIFYSDTICLDENWHHDNLIIKQLSDSYAIPIEEWFVEYINSLPKEIKPNCLFPCKEIFDLVTNKYDLYLYLDSKKVNTPKIYSLEQIKKLKAETLLVLKPSVGSGSRGVEFLSSRNAMEFDKTKIDNRFFCQRIGTSNEVMGFFVLCRDGEILLHYSHKRILTWPKSGGVSVLSEICNGDEFLEFAASITDELRLTGLCMIELMRHTDGELYLIEINPRVWGSFLLSTALESSMISNYILASSGVFYKKNSRFRKRYFIFPGRAIFSYSGLKHLMYSFFSRKYVVSGFYGHNFFKSLLFQIFPVIRRLLADAK